MKINNLYKFLIIFSVLFTGCSSVKITQEDSALRENDCIRDESNSDQSDLIIHGFVHKKEVLGYFYKGKLLPYDEAIQKSAEPIPALVIVQLEVLNFFKKHKGFKSENHVKYGNHPIIEMMYLDEYPISEEDDLPLKSVNILSDKSRRVWFLKYDETIIYYHF